MIRIIKENCGSSEEGHGEGNQEKEKEALRWKESDGKNKIRVIFLTLTERMKE